MRSEVRVLLGPPISLIGLDCSLRFLPSQDGRNIQAGGVAQLGEHLPCKQGVRSSILLVSTNLMNLENFIEETNKSLIRCDDRISTSDLNANLETSNEN